MTKFGLTGSVSKYYTAALQSTKCATVLQDPSQAGPILRDCFGDPKILLDAFGPKGLFLGALLVVAPVLEFFRSSVNAAGDLLNGRDRYTVDIGYTKPKPPEPPPLDPECKEDLVTAALCRFVVAATTGDVDALPADEQAIARQAADLPNRTWTVTSCELAGDITVLCEILYDGAPENSEPTAAAFWLQPAGGEYNAETGGYDVAPGEELRYEVVEYGGLGVPGTFAD